VTVRILKMDEELDDIISFLNNAEGKQVYASRVANPDVKAIIESSEINRAPVGNQCRFLLFMNFRKITIETSS
jgi:hypothetical protein